MPTYKPALAVVQSVREAAKGTMIAATSKVAFEEFKLTPVDELYRPQLAKSLWLANRGNETLRKRGVTWAISGDLVYNQLQHWLDMAVKGGLTAVGAVDPYTWTATRNATTDPAVKSRTFEVRLTDGATPSDWRFGYGMATKLEISAAENEVAKFALEGFGRKMATNAQTAGQALPTIDPLNPIALSKVYINDTWAAVGTTLVVAQVLGWKWTLETGEVPVYTADVRTDLDFTLDEVNIDSVKMGLEILLLATAGGQWATEKTADEAGTLRAVEIDCVASASRDLKIKGLYKYTAGSLFPDSTKDGLQTVSLKLEGSTDDINFVELVLRNGVNTI